MVIQFINLFRSEAPSEAFRSARISKAFQGFGYLNSCFCKALFQLEIFKKVKHQNIWFTI